MLQSTPHPSPLPEGEGASGDENPSLSGGMREGVRYTGAAVLAFIVTGKDFST